MSEFSAFYPRGFCVFRVGSFPQSCLEARSPRVGCLGNFLIFSCNHFISVILRSNPRVNKVLIKKTNKQTNKKIKSVCSNILFPSRSTRSTRSVFVNICSISISRNVASLFIKKILFHKVINQRYYIGFPGCVKEKDFTLFSKLGQLEQVFCCSKKTDKAYTN